MLQAPLPPGNVVQALERQRTRPRSGGGGDLPPTNTHTRRGGNRGDIALDLPNTARSTETVGVASWEGGAGSGAGAADGGGGGTGGGGQEAGGKEPTEPKERDLEAISIFPAGERMLS